MTNNTEIVKAFISGTARAKKESLQPPKLSGRTLQLPVEILFASNITPVDKLVLTTIQNFEDVSKSQLASMLNLARNTVLKSVKNLQVHNYIHEETIIVNNTIRSRFKLLVNCKDVVNFGDKKNGDRDREIVSPLIHQKDGMVEADVTTSSLEEYEDTAKQPTLVDYIIASFKKQVPNANISNASVKILVKRLDKPFGWYQKLFEAVEEQHSYLTGNNRNNWIMSINWLLNKDNAEKVLKGEFKDK